MKMGCKEESRLTDSGSPYNKANRTVCARLTATGVWFEFYFLAFSQNC